MFNVFCQGSQKTNASMSLPSTISASLNPVCFCAALKSPSSKSEPGNLWAAELPLKPREKRACVGLLLLTRTEPTLFDKFCQYTEQITHSFHAFDLCVEFWLLYNLGPLSHLEFSWSWNKLLNIVQYRTIVNEMCLLKWVDAQSIRGCLCCRVFNSIIRRSSRHERIYQICVFASSSFRYISVKEILLIDLTKQDGNCNRQLN